jgi:hypothetical protein
MPCRRLHIPFATARSPSPARPAPIRGRTPCRGSARWWRRPEISCPPSASRARAALSPPPRLSRCDFFHSLMRKCFSDASRNARKRPRSALQAGEIILREKAREECLHGILGVLLVVAAPTDIGVERKPVGAAKLLQRAVGLRRRAVGPPRARPSSASWRRRRPARSWMAILSSLECNNRRPSTGRKHFSHR